MLILGEIWYLYMISHKTELIIKLKKRSNPEWKVCQSDNLQEREPLFRWTKLKFYIKYLSSAKLN